MKLLKSIFFIVFACLLIVLFVSFRASITVWFSFLLSAFFLSLITIYHVFYEKSFSPFLSSYIVFTFLFFLAAPIVQIDAFEGIRNAKFMTLFPYNEALIITTNLIITLFNFFFIISYIIFKRNYKSKKNIIPSNQKKILPFTIVVFLILSILVVFFSFSFIQEEFIRPNWVQSSTSTFLLLIWKKFFFFIPFAGVGLCFQYFKNGIRNKNNFINIIFFLILFILILFWFKNPLTEKRNALGPIYITLIFLFSPRLLNTNIKMLSFLFFSMIIAFPMLAILTHTDASLTEIYNNPSIVIEKMKGGGIVDAFSTLNYDAFANTAATIELVNREGFSFGYQLLGGLFFFIPRSIWKSKPVSSGEMIGDYIVNTYNFNFTNLSNSFVSESFLNFGLLGVIIFAITLAFVMIKFISWLNSTNQLKKMMAFYFAIHLIFLLRGDFTNGFSYYVGPLLAVVYFTKFTEILVIQLSPLKRSNHEKR